MIKLLYSISIIALILAGFLFVLSGTQWLGGDFHENYTQQTISDKFQMLGKIDRINRNKVLPIIEQAAEYAHYLNPPKPPEPEIVSQPVIKTEPIFRPTNITPKFRLLSISYYLSNPEKSLALVSEPGKGDHWVKKGEWVGNFVVKSIEKRSIIYRDGNILHEMAVTTEMNTTQFAQQVNIETPKTVSNIDFANNNSDKEDYNQPIPIQSFLADENSNPVQSVRTNQKKNIKPSLRTLYTPN